MNEEESEVVSLLRGVASTENNDNNIILSIKIVINNNGKDVMIPLIRDGT